MAVETVVNGIRILLSSARTLVIAKRGAVATGEAIRTYPERRRARKAAKAQYNDDLEFHHRALDECLRRLNLDVTAAEKEKVLEHYVSRGSNLVEAYREYRCLLESGQRLPRKDWTDVKDFLFKLCLSLIALAFLAGFIKSVIDG